MYFYSFYYLLVSEIIPRDQSYIPKPNVGDSILVYGVWVQDNELSFLLGKNNGWHEIHPVKYVKINGVKYGSMSYDNKYLFEGIYDPERLVVLDKHSPLQNSEWQSSGCIQEYRWRLSCAYISR